MRAVAAMAAVLGVAAISQRTIAAPRAGESPHAYCARVGTDDTLRTPPRSLTPAIRRLFNLKGPNAPKTSYYRCAAGRLLVCWVGANLPCGKANTSRTLPGAAQWCRTHPNSDFIPMYVTGHDTIYSWRCIGDAAHAGALIGKLDGRGFFAEYWKKL
jgi:hypothetical protein